MSEIVFGDYEAEDAWDASDPPAAHVHNLAERIHALAEHLAFDGDVDETAPDVLDVLEADAALAARIGDVADRRHAAMLLEDLATVRAEVGR